jgi:GT2 family glycosyltransferase
MSRPAVSVVMPFAGDPAASRTALQTLSELHTRPGDELILADNSGVSGDGLIVAAGSGVSGDELIVAAGSGVSGDELIVADSREVVGGVDAIHVVRATAERSPAHARNVGAEHSQCDWILFVDADCRAPGDLLDSYFRRPIDPDVGAVAGEVKADADATTLAGRYGATRSFLGQAAHLAHPYLPRAAAANLLVRRAAFEQLGGFYEGVRAAEDTDFSWRLQRAGWRLELRPEAYVEHRYRSTVPDLTRQWRGYAAGRAWLGRRYEGFAPEPAARRAGARAWLVLRGRAQRAARPEAAQGKRPVDRRYLILDLLLGAQELIGLMLSNRPAPGQRSRRRTRRPWPTWRSWRTWRPWRTGRGSAAVVLVAGRFPAQGDPLVELARSLERARVEAAARPESLQRGVARALAIDYREDDGCAGRALALARLVVRHPLRCIRDRARRHAGGPSLAELAPVVRRLARDPDARVVAIGGQECDLVARRLAALAGRRLPRGEA